MASNNTDWVFGESRNPEDFIIPAVIKSGETGIQNGDFVKMTAGMSEGKPLEVAAHDSTDQVQSAGCVVNTPVTGVAAKGGDVVTIMVRGITRPRYTANGAITLGGPISQKNGKIGPASQNQDGAAIGRNIGGALANGDTGLVYLDCWGGTE